MASHSTESNTRPLHISDDDNTSRRSRARVSRACVRCRSRKDKCDGRQPECSNCTNAGQPCLYVAATKKRGLPEGYVRGMEKLWALMLQKVEGLDTTVRRVMDNHKDELLRIWNHHRLGDDLHTTWKESCILADLESLLSQIEHASPDLKRKRDREDSETAPTSAASPVVTRTLTPEYKIADLWEVEELVVPPQARPRGYQHGRYHFSQSNDTYLPQDRSLLPSSTSSNLNVKSFPTASLPLSDAASRALVLPSSTSSFLEQYFTYTHCWFPILDRPYILRKFYQYSRSQILTQPDSGDLACLWAICAYSHQQTNHLRTTPEQVTRENISMLRSTARSLIPTESGPFSLGHVQALLLLVLLDLGLGDWTSAWMLTGYAVRALLEVIDARTELQPLSQDTAVVAGLDNRTNFNTRTTPSEQQKQAVLQGCLILDTIISLRLGRTPHLRSHHVNLGSASLLNEDGHEEWEPWTAGERDMDISREPAFVMSSFNRLTELIMMVSDADITRHHPKNPDVTSSNHIVSTWQSLAEQYPFNISEVTRRAPHQMLLQACYFAFGATLPQAEPDIQQNALQHLCTTFELFAQSYNLSDRCGIPSILAAICRLPGPLCSDAPTQCHSVTPIRERHNMVASTMAKVWPAFVSTDMARTITLAGSPGVSYRNLDAVPSAMFPLTSAGSTFPPPAPVQQAGFNSLVSQPDIPLDCPMLQDDQLDPGLEQSRQPAVFDHQAMSIDMPVKDLQTSYDTENRAQKSINMGLGTSPSFNGDEIDALFHEMAQLDTTQWSLDRTQGLKDFGFSDDMTFEAFCNDPDRLMLSDGYMGPVFNNGGTASVGNPGPVNAGGTQLGRMSFEDIFR